MASYAGTAYLYFDNVNFGAVDFDEVISDSNADTVFTPGEAVTHSDNLFLGDAEGTYLGSISVGGLDLPVFAEANGAAANATSATTGSVYVLAPAEIDASALPPTLAGVDFTSSVTECFLTGTRVATPDGETAVEELAIGDEILTADGTTVPVRWVGWQKVVTAFQPPERLMPVRIQAGALGNGLPKRDLTLTGDHALCVDGMLINASALVNDTTITWVPVSEFGGSYTVYHVETENHDLILAEGTAAETYIDYLGRSNFHNYAEFVELYGETRTIPEMTLPRISAARLVPAATRARLAGAKAA